LFAICRTASADVTFVWLKDGRMLAGQIDPRTDDERLWLRSSGTAFVLATSVAWSNVEAGNIGGKQVESAELKKRVEELEPQPIANQLAAPAAKNEPITHLPRPITQRLAASRIESLEVEARVANWDRDAEDDGIEVRIYPRNTFGETVPVSGQLTVELVARNQLPLDHPDAFPRLGRWSLRADADDFTAGGAVYRLPFRSLHPTTNQSLERHGLVKATLLVFGQGRWEGESPTYLHRFNPVRDDLQRERNVRDR